MNTLFVSDRVIEHLYAPDVRRRYPDVKLLVGCGDLPFYYLEFLVSAFDVPMVYVLGNHDEGLQHTSDGRVLSGVQGGINLHGRVLLLGNTLCFGIEGSMRYKKDARLMYTETEMRLEILSMMPSLLFAQWRYQKRFDLLVCHSPPFGIHDDRDIAHTGFKVFLTLLRYFKPRFMVHGHVHRIGSDIPFRTKYLHTTIINVYPYRLIDI